MTKAERRAAMPECTQFIDALRHDFPDLNILYARENGIEWGEHNKGESYLVTQHTAEGKPYSFTATWVESMGKP